MLVTISEGSKILGVSSEHTRRMIRSGRWPFYRLGTKGTRIDVDEIKALGRLLAESESQKKRESVTPRS